MRSELSLHLECVCVKTSRTENRKRRH